MSTLDAETIAKLKSQHGKIEKLVAFDRVAVARQPSPIEWEAYTVAEEAEAPGAKYAALDRLFRDACVWPPAEELAAMLKEMPALGASFGTEVRAMAGCTNSVTREKL